ncbi:MAG: hypothetical protein EA383_01010 [Spirochaetaceae bacterium]|nr:MAG: hypothetical protein EA383_01010 [Spirochaetaceae bacterium]
MRLEAGRAVPWTSESLTSGEIRRLLQPVERSDLSVAGRAAYDRVRELIDPDPLYRETDTGFFGSINAQLALESYFNTADNETEWLKDYSRRLPLLTIPVEFGLARSFYARGDLLLRNEHATVGDPDFLTNVPTGIASIDFQFPLSAYALAGGDTWFAHLGRDQLRWGSGRSGVMVLGDEPDYYEFARFGVTTERFRYTGLVVDLEARMSSSEEEAFRAVNQSEFERYNKDREDAKTLYLHRFELELGNRVSLAISEGSMYGTRRGTLRLWNPLMIYHNFFDSDHASAMLGVEFNVRPARHLNIYGEWGMNQFGTTFKREAYDTDDIPDAFGFLLGAEALVPTGPRFMTGGLEFAYTNPWFGVREHPYTTWHWRRRTISNLKGSRPVVTRPIGYRFGPDTMLARFDIGYLEPGIRNGVLSLTYRLRGENTIETPYERSIAAASARTPSGDIVERSLITELSVSEQLGFRWIPDSVSAVLRADLAFLRITNLNNQEGVLLRDLQISPALVLQF